jgi:hypothetical protein
MNVNVDDIKQFVEVVLLYASLNFSDGANKLFALCDKDNDQLLNKEEFARFT